MSFLLITRRTFIDLSSPVRTLLLIVIGILIPVLSSLSWRSNLEYLPLNGQNAYAAGNFFSVSFIWTCGIFLALMVSIYAISFISRERSDGTLLLLVSKPLGRWQIVIAKLLALVLYALLLQAIILISSVLLIWLWLKFDVDTLNALLRSALWILPYSLLIALSFATVSVALSTLLRNNVTATLVVILFILMVFLLGYFSNNLFPSTYQDKNLSRFDLGAHLCNTFISLVEASEAEDIIPEYYKPLTGFTGLEPVKEPFSFIGYWDIAYSTPYHPGGLGFSMSPVSSLAIWLAIIIIALGMSIVAIERKDVN